MRESSTKLLPLFIPLALSLFAVADCLAVEKPASIKANHSRLVSTNGLVYLAKRGTELPSGEPFTGIAFWEECWGRAEVTYKDGVLDGEVWVVANGKLLSKFRYDKGVKVSESRFEAPPARND